MSEVMEGHAVALVDFSKCSTTVPKAPKTSMVVRNVETMDVKL